METSLQLATDSFSYSWLPNSKLPLDGPEVPLRDSFHSSNGETSKEFNFCRTQSEAESQNLNFDFSVTQSASVLAHADELFCDGLIRPVFLEPSKGELCSTPDANETRRRFSFSSAIQTPTLQIHRGFLTKIKGSTRRTLKDLVRCLNQFRHIVGFSRKSTRVDDFDETELQLETWSSSQSASPKTVIAHSVSDSYDHENPIYEAVLHCKRSIGK